MDPVRAVRTRSDRRRAPGLRFGESAHPDEPGASRLGTGQGQQVEQGRHGTGHLHPSLHERHRRVEVAGHHLPGVGVGQGQGQIGTGHRARPDLHQSTPGEGQVPSRVTVGAADHLDDHRSLQGGRSAQTVEGVPHLANHASDIQRAVTAREPRVRRRTGPSRPPHPQAARGHRAVGVADQGQAVVVVGLDGLHHLGGQAEPELDVGSTWVACASRASRRTWVYPVMSTTEVATSSGILSQRARHSSSNGDSMPSSTNLSWMARNRAAEWIV